MTGYRAAHAQEPRGQWPSGGLRKTPCCGTCKGLQGLQGPARGLRPEAFMGPKGPYPANASKEASGGLWAGLERPSKKNDLEEAVCVKVWGTLFQGRPDRLLASILPGSPRSPLLPVGLGDLSPARGL